MSLTISKRWIAVPIIALSCMSLRSTGDSPVELGKVQWGRDFDAALAQAASAEKPILLLFQEIPG